MLAYNPVQHKLDMAIVSNLSDTFLFCSWKSKAAPGPQENNKALLVNNPFIRPHFFGRNKRGIEGGVDFDPCFLMIFQLSGRSYRMQPKLISLHSMLPSLPWRVVVSGSMP